MTNGSTLLDLISRENPEQAALVVPDGPTVTYRSLLAQVEQLACLLQQMGISRNDRVAMVLPNGIEAVIAFLAAATAATAAPLNPAYKVEEFQYYLADMGAKTLILPADGADPARQAASPETVIIESRIDAGGQIRFSRRRA